MSTSDADIAIVTVIPEEYGAVHTRLHNPAHDVATSTPNLFGWEVGTVPRTDGGEYRVVLALAGKPGTLTCSQAIIETVNRWNPRYVLLLGIAGGLAPDEIALGDVVVSSVIYGYEYGKVERKFIPRHNWVYHPDDALFASALRFYTVNSSWAQKVAVSPSLKAPKALPGIVASGEKVVDNPANKFFKEVIKSFPGIKAVEMEGLGAASAIDLLRAKGRALGFIMIRGISDLPKPDGERKTVPKGSIVSGQTLERDATKVFAAESAASFAISWIAEAWPVPPKLWSPPPPAENTVIATANSKLPSKGKVRAANTYRHEDSACFFHDRMCDAFPGIMGPLLVTNPKECVTRLRALFKNPILIEGSTVIWEVGDGTTNISSFKVIDDSTVLIEHDRFKIAQLLGYRSRFYWRDFVLLHWNAEQPTGLYQVPPAEELADWATKYGPYNEEYGVWRKKLVTRAEYDDGTTFVDGKLKKISARLEVRHLTPGATFLVAQYSPLNDIRNDLARERILSGLIQGTVTHEQIAAWVESLPKHHRA